MIISIAANVASAQTSYYNLETSRPLRVDDALPTERNALEVFLAPLRIESYGGGLQRYRIEPKLSYGILPRTEIEVRVPVVRVRSADTILTGVASLGLGASHTFTLEGPVMPAMAIGGEWLLPVGTLAPPRSSYGVTAALTKTFSLVRVHLNAGAGTYSVQPTSNAANCVVARSLVLGSSSSAPVCRNGPGVVVPDLPCSVEPPESHGPTESYDMNPSNATAPATTGTQTGVGSRTFLGVGIDHAFARQSTLVMADVTSERFVGLYPTPDLTVEIGMRHQLSPFFVLDAGVSRKMIGTAQYSAVTVGATYERSVPPPEFCAP